MGINSFSIMVFQMVQIRLEKILYCPSCIFFIIWSFAIIIYSSMFSLIALETILYFLLFFVFMFIGNLFGSRFKIASTKSIIPSENLLRQSCKILFLITLIYSLQMIMHILSFDSLATAFLDIRRANLSGEPVVRFYNFYIGIAQLLLGIGILGYLVNYYKFNNINNKIYLFSIGLSLISSLFDGSRSFLLTGVIWFLVLSVLINNLKLKTLIIYLVIILILFSITFSIFRPIGDDLVTGFKYTGIYISGGVGALESAIKNQIIVYWQDLESILNKFALLGLPIGGYDLTQLKIDFVYLDNEYQTNVFTALGVYIQYFSYFALFIGFIIGFIGGYLSFLARRNLIGRFLYSLFICSIVLSLFHDYILSFSYYVFKIFVVLIILFISENIFKNLILKKGFYG